MRKPIHLPLGKGLLLYSWLAACFPVASVQAQPCPNIINCPQSTPTYCDESPNDINFWNDAPYTLSPTIGDANLHEGNIDLNIKVKGCAGGGLVSISYLLYLDLDNDGLQETVIMSGTPPPGGIVFANNSFNPGYSGGDTVRFDKRALPDSMLYRFRLEIAYSADTTTGWIRMSSDHDPYNYIPVILPEGRHRIEWRIAQDGVERYCDRNFKIKDCGKPSVACKPGLAVYLDASQSATLNLQQALLSVSDNVTPDSQLVLGMRRGGSGFGFPLNAMGDPQDTVVFNCQNSENQFVEIWAKDKAGNQEFCTAPVLVYDTSGVCPFAPPPTICAHTYWNGQTIKGVSFKTNWTIPGQSTFSHALTVGVEGCTQLSELPPTSLFTLNASKDTVPLNGVTTYDLVLISKHILGVEPFDAGWKIMAADVNNSNSVTTFDIVELRKMILGLTSKLPGGTPSWRFFVDTCSVWGNPYYGNCPTAYSLPVQPLSAYPPNLSFKGIKMGDVNGTAATVDTLNGSASARSASKGLVFPEKHLQRGEITEIPMRAGEEGDWTGAQFTLHFNPEKVEVLDIKPAEMLPFDGDNWAIPAPGELNFSWSDATARTVLPGDELLKIRIRAHQNLNVSELFDLPGSGRLSPEVYDETGESCPLELRYSNESIATASLQILDAMPNPTTGGARIPLRLSASERIVLEVTDLSGRIILRTEQEMEAGSHLLEVPAAVLAIPGAYAWRVCAGAAVRSGRLLRI